ncbi:MAG: ABC transporter permease [Nitrospinota bacterium]|jgi:tungstate transport system permease protein|nr:ABC transporter permease [Nitrospinota bacterium]MDP6483435.1 ABC transporter permease [Nitrospinota bacterium]HJM44123.1 ABC transporter permease [Nitrospinota bacterium]
MEFLWEGLWVAGRLILRADPEVVSTAATSLYVAAWSTVGAALFGLPVGYLLAVREFRGRETAVTVVNALLGLPTVVVGLVAYAFLSRRGLLGGLGLLFTPAGVILGLVVLATPIVAAFVLAALKGMDPRVRLTAFTLGAGPVRTAWTLLAEARYGVIAAIVAAFGRVVAEVGIAMMLGGNIRGYTRTLSTAIALETAKGEFGFGIALGVILMALVTGLNAVLRLLQTKVSKG